ncbi:hypothetical protein CFC21_078063 [Triticum aestivum]|uniref:STAS domain-containing protein n=2 Tax=Triticum aestivum TaxID=4565 RepID=A0A9R1HW04_WHEAT|nr:hypothetical protein CFC21_078063 [Triticum aestivum]
MTGAKPLVLALPSPSSGSTEAADVAAVPDLLYVAEKARARTHDVPREDEEAKLSLMARVGKVLFQRFCVGGSPVSLDVVRDLAEAGTKGSKSPVVDKQGMVSKMSCKCIVQEDGKLAIDKNHTGEEVQEAFLDLDDFTSGLNYLVCGHGLCHEGDKHGVKIIHEEAIVVGQSFATVRWIMEWVRAEVDTSNEKVRERVQSVVFDMSNVVNIDTSGLVGLEEIHKDLASLGIQFHRNKSVAVKVEAPYHLNEHPARVVRGRYGGPDGEREPPLERGGEPLGEDLRGEQERVRGRGGDPRGVPGPEAVEDVERRERGADEEPAHDVRGEEEALGAEEDGLRRVGLPGALQEVCNFGFVAAAVEQDFIPYPEKVLEMRKGFIVLGKDDDFCA